MASTSMKAAEIDAKDLAHNITATLHIKRGEQLRWRLWIAMRLIRLACWIGWMNFGGIEEML